MPIDEAAYSADLRSTILGAGCEAIDGPKLTALCDAIAAATVRAIHTATVNVPATGIASPPGTAGGPCLGAATGTIT